MCCTVWATAPAATTCNGSAARGTRVSTASSPWTSWAWKRCTCRPSDGRTRTVGRPELQAFYGALAGQKAKRGVFITTSGFTAHAVAFASSVEGIVLVDGARLVHLMMDHEVGVTARLLKVPTLDTDYFNED